MTIDRTASNSSGPADGQSAFTVRATRRKDIPGITRLSTQLGYPDALETIAFRYRRIMKDRRNHRVFVAVSGGSTTVPGQQVIGWLHVFVDKLLTVGPWAEIGGLVVDEQWRSRGVGAALVDRAEQWARQRRFDQIVVHTNALRTRAHRFYERCGYKPLKQSRVYIKVVNSPAAMFQSN